MAVTLVLVVRHKTVVRSVITLSTVVYSSDCTEGTTSKVDGVETGIDTEVEMDAGVVRVEAKTSIREVTGESKEVVSPG